MSGIHDFGIFLAASLALTLTPGPDTFYILGRSVAQGRCAGLASVMGITCGLVVHTIAAALGLSALLVASAPAFLAVKLIGAAYLIWLGARMLFGRGETAAYPVESTFARTAAIFRQGLVTNLLNPKVAFFFLAFMPQFIRPETSRRFLAFVTLGLCFIVIGTLWSLCLAWFASQLGSRLRESTGTRLLQRLAGGLLVGLGIRLVATR